MSSASIAHATTWNGSALRNAFGARAGNDPGDPVGHVSRNMREQRRPVGAELVEEHVQRGVVAAGPGPHEPAAVMIDDHDQIAVAAFVGDLVDPDPAQPLETIDVAGRCPRSLG